MNQFKKFFTCILCGVMALGMIGCGGKIDDSIRTDKEQIYIYAYDGGHGQDWLKVLCEQFNEEYAYDLGYQVFPVFAKFNEQQLLSTIGKDEYRMYISSPCAFTSAIYEDKLEDLSDLFDEKASESESMTIGEKMLRKDEFQQIYSKYGEGCYAMPFAESIMGFVYDHDLFLEEEWYTFATQQADGAALQEQGIAYAEENGKLKFVSSQNETNYEEGDFILTAGKDGKYGTYDDGQPITEQEWMDLLDMIASVPNQYPLTWSGAVVPYTNNIFAAIFAQYSGMDDFKTYFRYDSLGQEVELLEDVTVSGNSVSYGDTVCKVITPDNGYEVFKMEGLVKAYEFMNKYMNYKNPSATPYINQKSAVNASSQFDAQNQFLLGTLSESFDEYNPRSAMLCEGAWWEFEAKPMFDTLGQYGQREYRYMLLPDIEGQKMTKSAVSCEETGIYFIAKDTNTTRLGVTKEFLKFLLRDENLRYFSTETGSIMPYQYELTEEDESKLTPFSLNVRDLYYDSENIEVVRHSQLQLSSPISYLTGKNLYERYPTQIKGVRQNVPLTVLENYGTEGLSTGINGMRTAYTQSEWASYVELCRNNGFFND